MRSELFIDHKGTKTALICFTLSTCRKFKCFVVVVALVVVVVVVVVVAVLVVVVNLYKEKIKIES